MIDVRKGNKQMAQTKEKKYMVSMMLTVDEGAKEELKIIEHHAESLLDLDGWPEIKAVSNVHVDEVQDASPSYMELVSMFKRYVANDMEAAGPEYLIQALEQAWITQEIANVLGLPGDVIWAGEEQEEELQ